MNVPLMLQTLFDASTAGDISKAGKTALAKTGTAGGFAAVMGQVRNAGQKDTRMISQTPTVPLKGHALIAQLKKNLQSSGVPLDQLTADDSAMAAIEKVLVDAGFEAKQVRNLLGELKMNADANGVRVSALFEGISRLTEPAVAKSQPAYLEISSLPHIETLLTKFGLTPDQIKTALNSAKVEGKGIDAGRLASELKPLRQGVGPKKNIAQDEDESGQIAAMMQQIGLTASINRSGQFDLEKLVVALEKFAGSDVTVQSKGGTKVTTGANKQIQGQSLSAANDHSSLDRFTAELKMAAIPTDGAVSLQKPSEDWELFVNNVKSVPSGKAVTPGFNVRAPFLSSQPSRDTLLTGAEAFASQNGISNSLFSDHPLLQSVIGKESLAEKGSNSQSKAGIKAGIAIAGSPNAVKAGLADVLKAGGAAEANIEETVAANTAKTGDQGVDPLLKPGKGVRKLSDSATFALGDGVARRAETKDSVRISAPPQPAGRMFPQHLLDQVSRQILLSRLTNESEIQIQLKPSTLGRLKMSIENTAEGLKVNIIAENSAARDMLLSNSGDLKTALMEQGLRLDTINVETQADFNQTMADTRQGSEGFDGRKRFSGGNRHQAEASTSEMGIMSVPQTQASGLDLVA